MTVTPISRRQTVYVTSTLGDMVAERDYLRSRVFPELKSRLAERHHPLESIDLRWGVAFDSDEDLARQELLAMKVCLGEIERARPLQIVLLGDCYGWIPPRPTVEAIAEEAGFETDPAGKSITELEIEFGLTRPSDSSPCFFYFREPLPYDGMPDDIVGRFYDAEHIERLAALKERLEREMPRRVRHYRAEWDRDRRTVVGLEEFGRMVLDDLWQALDEAIRQPAGAEQESAPRCATPSRSRQFIGRETLTDQLLGLARSSAEPAATWAACVTGISGAGKTALWNHLRRRLESEDLILLAYSAGTVGGMFQVDAMLRAWTESLADGLGIAVPIDGGMGSMAVEATFADLLRRVAAERRVVLLIDGLNQFEPTPRAQRLAWLPQPWPDNARLIATARPGPASETLGHMAGVDVLPLAPFTPDEARRFAEAVGQQYHRPVPPEAIDCLLAKRLPGGAAAAGIPLWLETALEELILLDLDGAGGTAEGSRDARLLAAARDLPADVESLYDWVIRRNEESLGAGCVSGFVNLIALSRRGLRESALGVLIPKVARLLAPTAPRVVWNDLAFALLRRAFRAHLVEHVPEGQWDFAHARFRETVKQRNLRDPQIVHQLHTAIAYHLKSLPDDDPLRHSELMVHLIGSEDRLRAAHYYASELSEAELAGATRSLADHMLAGARETPNPGLALAASLLIEPKLNRSQVGTLCRRFHRELLDALAHNAPVEARRRLADATRQAAEELCEQEPDNPEWQECLAVSYGLLAAFHEEAGHRAEAQTCRDRGRATLQSLHEAGVELSAQAAEFLERFG